MNTKTEKYNNITTGSLYFTKILKEIGLNDKYTGYYYLIEIVNLVINENIKPIKFYKNIYPLVAIKFNKTECTVERNIRNLIDKCWNNKMQQNLNCRFLNRKPSCCRFVVIVINYN